MSTISHIKNPLTIIGIFAGIVEISANIVLPLLDPPQQSTYLWFLMVFPTLLVLAFFGTLNFNHVALYAPSDYNNDKGFMQANGKVVDVTVQGGDASRGITWP